VRILRPPETLLDRPSLDGLRAWLDPHWCQEPVCLALDDLDLEDDAGICAAWAAYLRDRARETPLTLEAPPQVLAHTLYRIGATTGPHAVSIRSPRSEIGTSS
jgi:hypothetical protein